MANEVAPADPGCRDSNDAKCYQDGYSDDRKTAPYAIEDYAYYAIGCERKRHTTKKGCGAEPT